MPSHLLDSLNAIAAGILHYSALLFVIAIGAIVAYLAVLYIKDMRQTQHAIRRNYPLIGRFRYFFEHLGEFFRQYFFAMDREELPFNRSQRSWVYRAAKNVDTTIAFGSTRPLNHSNEVLFMNCLFATLSEDAAPTHSVTIGEGYCAHPHSSSAIFHISGMSYGAISKPAIQALSAGAKEAGIWLNTGEGGLSPYHLEAGCDLVFQIGTAKYGVRDEQGNLSEERLREIAAYPQVRMFEIKLSQGAKPGKGGILPGGKVTPEVARIRGIPEGQDSISPNGHPDIRSIDDLLDMVVRIRRITNKPVGFKTVLGFSDWLDELGEAIHRRGLDSAPDFITIDSADGGTGAAPQSLMDYVGLPLRRSLPLVVDKLSEYRLRERIKVIASGKMINPAEAAWALCVGADFIVSARGFMFALGCIQALQCNKNTCPTGVTTHDPDLQQGLVPADKSRRVANYARNLMHEVGVIAHSCGVREARALQRRHVYLIDERGVPEPLTDRYPDKTPRPEYLIASDAESSDTQKDTA
ncbi:MAG: FMN-binding glutamate synthase family protein [Spongiibacter sp.]|uniref:FMN-binding glutamate synthase family protein n=1 Tax=Spongiibacter thalassae TaxID=2721624 RepID=A0ABX1GIB4_9GAMM|nr:FMN-binding glutamate synthase family protein [Spongiibacter thalassae]MDX1504519.1 FMN-binding glutamate synthase family protein [Spongiibacter sp.]NKI18965.1 FMN-binding glutamate synthase family protein [Spongiibacter thalassae]